MKLLWNIKRRIVFKHNKSKSMTIMSNNKSQNIAKLLEQATHHFNKGRSFYLENLCDEAITQLRECLSKRESIMGRYNLETADVYDFIGDSFAKKGDINSAIVGYHTCMRIRRHLSDDINNQAVNYYCSMEESLKELGLTEEEIKLYNFNLEISVQHEKDGDAYREDGKYALAIKKYNDAITAEKNCVSNLERGLRNRIHDDQCRSYDLSSQSVSKREKDKHLGPKNTVGTAIVENHKEYFSPDKHWIINCVALAFLWRKIACILGINDTDNCKTIEWSQIDRIDGKWNKQNIHRLSDDILSLVQHGDICHVESKYMQALESYEKSIHIARDQLADDIVEGLEMMTWTEKEESSIQDPKHVHNLRSDTADSKGVSCTASGSLDTTEESHDNKMNQMKEPMITLHDKTIPMQSDVVAHIREGNEAEAILEAVNHKLTEIQRSMIAQVDYKMDEIHREIMKRVDETMGQIHTDVIEHVKKGQGY